MSQTTKLKSNIRTIIERGAEIGKDKLDREGGIYAVSRRVDYQDAPEWGVVKFKNSGYITTYNVATRNQWATGLITIQHLRFYEPTQLEREMVDLHESLNQAVFDEHQAKARLKLYTDSRWHRVADILRKFFSI